MMAVFNRGLLRAQTGDYRGAIQDYTTVINQYPNFPCRILSAFGSP